MMIPRPLALSLLPALLAGIAAPAAPAADTDRFTVRASVYDTDARIRMRADGQVGNEEIHANFDDVGLLGDDARSARFELGYRFGERHRLSASYYDLAPGGAFLLDEDYALPGIPPLPGLPELPEVPDVPAGSRLDYGIDFRLATLMYEYALLQDERWTVGVQGGLHWAKLSAFADLDVPGIAQDRVDWERRRHSIALGARVEFRPDARWRFGLEAQGYDTEWGNFVAENGHFERFGLLAEYRFTPRFGVHAGYDWFRLKLRDTVEDADEFYSVLLDGELRVHGPTLGLTLAF